MTYTKHFSFITKENGPPNLSEYQFRRMMNIVFVEGKIEGMKKKAPKNGGNIDMDVFQLEKKLTELTGNLTPGTLLKELFELSQHERS